MDKYVHVYMSVHVNIIYECVMVWQNHLPTSVTIIRNSGSS